LAQRATRGHGRLTVVPTAGSIENVKRLTGGAGHCAEKFALIQDGTPVSANANIELLGRLPDPESLMLLGKSGNTFRTFVDLRGAAIGIGPEGSGTAYLMRQLFEDSDLRQLGVRFSYHSLPEQAQLVEQGKLQIAAFVMPENAEFLHTIMRQHDLDIVAPADLQGLIARYPWLSLGSIPPGRYDLVRPIPSVAKPVANLATLVVANACARRADRNALLVLLAAELPAFVRSNPPRTTSSATAVPLATEAQQFFVTGEPGLADRYFPWLVNILSPAYWVYLVMAVTVLSNASSTWNGFRLWRIDARREKLETSVKELVDPKLTHAQIRDTPADRLVAASERRADAETLLQQLLDLRSRCQRYTNSFVTPMGGEMAYRYQQWLIDDAITTLGALLKRSTGLGFGQNGQPPD
jgi:hypothetical protein